MSLKKADFFANSIGVFQGGGCKAIAYIGAYKATKQAGVMFSEVAGTSAGSIIAAMIAVGISPEKLEELTTSEKISAIPKLIISKLKWYYIILCIASWIFIYLLMLPFILLKIFFYDVAFNLFKGCCICIKTSLLQTIKDFKILNDKEFVIKFKHNPLKYLKDVLKKTIWDIIITPYFIFKTLLGDVVINVIKTFKYSHFLNIAIITVLAKKYGLYDSREITELIKKWFTKAGVNEKIKFKELKTSLIIVSTDIERKKAKIWSSEETPDEPIATAVAASCAIPFFFTPVEDVNVDGGLISNRPDFVFVDKPHVYNSIISFKLKSQEKKAKGFSGFISNMVSTLIDGSDSIQHSLIPSVEEIEIHVDIDATDFGEIDKKKIQELIKAGEDNVNRILDNEADERFLNRVVRPKGYLKNRERTYTEVSLWSDIAKYKKIIVYESTLDWVWSLFPTLISWIENRTKVLVYSEDIDDDYVSSLVNEMRQKERWTNEKAEELKAKLINERDHRIKTLRNLGCIVERFRKNKTKGFLFISGNDYSAIAIQYLGDKKYDKSIESKIYSDSIDSHMLKMQIDATDINNKLNALQSPGPVSLNRISVDEIKSRLESLPPYQNSKFTIAEVNISELCFLNIWLRGFEYNQIKHIFNLYKKHGLYLFEPAKVVYSNGEESYMAPIVVEKHQDKLYVIKGNIRCLYAYKHGIKELTVVIVENVEWTLPIEKPSDTYSIDQLFVREVESSGASRYEGFVKERFRYIEQAIRP